MRVVYYNPRLYIASFICACVHAGADISQISIDKIKEISKGLDFNNPFLIYCGRGRNGEEVYFLNGSCPESIIMKTVESFLTVYARNRGELLWINPLPGNNVFLTFAEVLGSSRLKRWAYRYYMDEIKASVERAGLQSEKYSIGV